MTFVSRHFTEETHATEGIEMLSDEDEAFLPAKSTTLYEQSPFYVEGKRIFDAAVATVAEGNANPRRNVALAQRFSKHAMPYAPLWLSIIEDPMRFACDSPQRNFELKGYREAIVVYRGH